ncbi:hypothetical protein R1flu_013795 [Riccia fluitans]|uniref:EthD domain-containing protein n=1 Tax=Riccia fluitans TaxID=41844 RepID=A0ABD1YHS1_9MARC
MLRSLHCGRAVVVASLSDDTVLDLSGGSMANQARLVLLQPEGMTTGFDWIGKLTDALSRLPSVREKITQIVDFQRNDVWCKTFGEVGYPLKPFTGALSIYSSDVESLKELISTILSENEITDSLPVWLVGYDETKMTNPPKDPSKPLAKFMGLIIRNPNLTTPEFHSHWSGPHAALFCSKPLPQQKVVIYTQFHSSPEWTKDFAQLGLNVAEYEGIVELWFDTLEDMVAVFASPEHIEAMMPDEAIFVNLEKSGVMIGCETVETKKYTAAS